MKVPDRWIILATPVCHKIFSGGYGGYCGSDSWWLSSMIVDHEDCDKYLEVTTSSGSVYRLYKDSCGMSRYMESTLNSWQTRLKDANQPTLVDITSTYLK